jgi:hypothetical protein
MKRIQLGDSQPARAVLTWTGFLSGVVLLFVAVTLGARSDSWLLQLWGFVGFLAAVRIGGTLARRCSSAYALVSATAIQVHQHGPLWPAATFPRKLVRSASELRVSDAGPVWSLRLSFVDNSEQTFGSFTNASIHDAIRELNSIIDADDA